MLAVAWAHADVQPRITTKAASDKQRAVRYMFRASSLPRRQEPAGVRPARGPLPRRAKAENVCSDRGFYSGRQWRATVYMRIRRNWPFGLLGHGTADGRI